MPGLAEAPFADAVVVAAGSGRRMGGADKLTALLEGRSVLEWSVSAMAAAASVRHIVVVAADDRVKSLSAEPWLRDLEASVVPGGERRQDSMARGVMATDSSVVLVHDGARPFCSPAVIDAVAIAARDHGAAVPLVPVVDSLKRLEAGAVTTVDRDGLFRAQTPQGARRQLLLDAHRASARDRQTYSDEAALLAAHGTLAVPVAGDTANIKVTEPTDLEVARAIAALRAGSHRSGHGIDTHPFGPDDGLRLGGLELPDAPRLHGHSDGDVVIHAIADALLGAAALPDLGRQFPASDPETTGIASADLLCGVIDRIAAAGWCAASVDVSIVGARPHLGGQRLDEMRRALGMLLGIAVQQVGVKASTGNLSGPEGAGRAITATALVSIVPR